MLGRYVTVAFVVIITIVLLVYAGSTIVKGGPGALPGNVTEEGVHYELFYIEGMPCMRVGRASQSDIVWAYDGVTCDWSKWEGR